MRNRKDLRYYKTPNGKVPFYEWLNGIKDLVVRTRIKQRIDRMELGHYGDYKAIGTGLCELRLDFGPGYRIYFTEHSEFLMLLCAGDKSTQNRDIDIAKTYLERLKREVCNG